MTPLIMALLTLLLFLANITLATIIIGFIKEVFFDD